ncbi:MAG: glutathione peroxidase [Gammaproteobacteria bacterium]|nr:glutathione peroxidase [Gammaproteobacteria bacterium]
MTTVFDFSARRLDGREEPLSRYHGKVLLIVNVASQCGFTPQYKGLEELYQRYRPRGFEVLGFPCNQFARQEPGSAGEIEAFCERNYGVSFPLFAKIRVNGAGAHPLYRHLKQAAPGIAGSKAVKWNFTKFLVDREGRVAGRFASRDEPDTLNTEIEALL